MEKRFGFLKNKKWSKRSLACYKTETKFKEKWKVWTWKLEFFISLAGLQLCNPWRSKQNRNKLFIFFYTSHIIVNFTDYDYFADLIWFHNSLIMDDCYFPSLYTWTISNQFNLWCLCVCVFVCSLCDSQDVPTTVLLFFINLFPNTYPNVKSNQYPIKIKNVCKRNVVDIDCQQQQQHHI